MSNTVQDPRPTEERRSTGAVSVRGGAVRKTPLGWLPWTALLLAGIIGLGALLIARNVGDAGDDPGVDLTDNAAAEGQDPEGPDANRNDGTDSGGDPDDGATGATGSGATAGSSTASSAAPAAGGAPAATGAGAVTANGQALLPLPAGGLAAFADQAAEGKGVNVESVVADEGFWVGSDPNNRVFVFLSDEAKAAEGESPFQVKTGQQVDFSGTVKALPNDLTPFGVDRSEGADQLRQQGHYIELRSVALAG
jgi:hypothetical protein